MFSIKNMIKNYKTKKERSKRAKLIQDCHKLKNSICEYFRWDIKVARDFISTCGITNVEVKNDIYYITLNRPGIFIGKKGCVINGIQDDLGCEIKLIETNISAYLHIFDSSEIDFIMDAHE